MSDAYDAEKHGDWLSHGLQALLDSNYLQESGRSLYDGPRNTLQNLWRDYGPATLQGMSGAASTALSSPIRGVTGGNAGFGTAVDALLNPLTLNRWGDRAERFYDPLEERFSKENEGLAQPLSAVGEAYLNHPLGMGASVAHGASAADTARNSARDFVETNAPGADQTNMFAGPRARNANLQKMAKAQDMARSGASPDEIWNKTGWFQGADNMWRFEIPDDKLGLKRVKGEPGYMLTNRNTENGIPEQEYIGPRGTFTSFSHPDLIGSDGAYRFNERIRGKYGYDQIGGGLYQAPLPPEMIDWYHENGSTPSENRRYGKITSTGFTQEDAKSTLAHELQHGIQYREGFANGGSPQIFTPEEVQAEKDNINKNGMLTDAGTMFYARGASDNAARISLYNRLAGETEARNVQKRLDYTPDQRAAEPPWETQGVPNEQQILRNRWGQEYDHTKTDARGRKIIPAVAGGAIAADALAPDSADASEGSDKVNNDYYDTLSQVESGGRNIGSSTSSATGPFQILEGTWNDIMKRHPELGLKPEDRTDPDKQQLGIRAFTHDNADHLEAAGMDPTNTNLYMAHFLGAGGGASFLKAYQNNPNAPAVQFVSPDAVAANRSVFLNGDGSPKTLSQVYQNFDRKFSGGTVNQDPFQSALDSFNSHLGGMSQKYGYQGNAGAQPGQGMPQGASPIPQMQMTPQQAMLAALLRGQGQGAGQPMQPPQMPGAANYGGVPSPNYAAAGATGGGGASSILQAMMQGRQQNNLLALLTGNSGASQ